MTRRTPPLFDLVNMSPAEIRAWSEDPRSTLASTDTGRRWQRDLADGIVPEDHKRLAATIWRHVRSIQEQGFRSEKAKSGFTGRHICLMNLGHDPRRPAFGVDLSHHDVEWLVANPRAKERRR